MAGECRLARRACRRASAHEGDPGLAEVRNAIGAAVVVATPGTLRRPIPAEACLEEVRRDRFSGMERAVVSVHRRWNDGPSGGIRL